MNAADQIHFTPEVKLASLRLLRFCSRVVAD